MSDTLVRPFRYASKAVLVKLALFAVMLLDSLKMTTAANLQQELPERDTNVAVPEPFAAKRNWQSLNGAWGKRSLGAGISAELADADDVYFAERRVPLPFSLGDDTNPVLKYSLVYLRNGANALEDNTAVDSRISENLKTAFDADVDSIDGIDNAFSNEKRAWKSMNVAWGKRRNSPQWNKFKGSWGKRETGWNNLKGMWGKRSNKDWQKLHGSWGKRASQNFLDTN